MSPILIQTAQMICCTIILGTMLGYVWPLAKHMEFRERVKKAAAKPRKKVPSMGDINWELYLRDVNYTADFPAQSEK